MFISIIFFIIIVIVIYIFVPIYAKAKKIKEKHIEEARKRGDLDEVKRLENMSDDQAALEFEDELDK